MGETGYLILENGQAFAGERRGAWHEVSGELVFTTGMTGYLETLSDPSYYGQIVMQTFPLIGNYGVIPADYESGASHVRAYIARDMCDAPSNFRAQGKLEDYLVEQNVPALTGVDTRRLTRIVREHGVMNARLCDKPYLDAAALAALKGYTVENAVESVTTGEEQTEGAGDMRVVLWDFGAKRNIKRSLLRRGLTVVTVPASTTSERIMALRPDGVMLSNGPGDPAENVGIIAEIQKLFDARIPIFGICLGHQMMALAFGAQTQKLKYGHRGANQPVCEIATGRVYITSQNHGYCVVADTLPKGARESFNNANDGTCEGIEYADFPAFSVQFHPEACAGPQDTAFLFDRFCTCMKEEKAHAAR